MGQCIIIIILPYPKYCLSSVAQDLIIVSFFVPQLDSWSVILNGHVEVTKPDESVDQLHLGDR